MPRQRKTPSAPSRLLPPLLRYVRQQGGDVGALARRFNLPASIETLDEATVEPGRFEELLEAVATEVGDPFLGLHLPAVLAFPRYSMAELAARAAPTLRQALERVVRFGSSFYAQLSFGLKERDGEFIFTHRLRGGQPGGQHGNEYALASILTHSRRTTGLPLQPRRLWFTHRREGDLGELVRFFGTPDIAFGRSENALVFEAAVLATPLQTEDPRLLATIDELAERAVREQPAPSDLTATVAARIRQGLGGGTLPEASAVARALRVSARTLARRLEDEGTTFKAVVESVRRDLACRQLEDPAIPLGEVAYRLGFSDVATFSRAFKRWTGKSPGAYRRGEPGPSAPD
jgi:AraC-like DNA-binding protein